MSTVHIPPIFWPLFVGLSLLPSLIFFGYGIRRYFAARQNRPKIAPGDIVYPENFASGASPKNWITKIGGVRNCLRLVVTRDLLWVTSWILFRVPRKTPRSALTPLDVGRWMFDVGC